MKLNYLNVCAVPVKSVLRKVFSSKPFSLLSSRKQTLITQIDFLIDTLSINKMDIMYMEKLKMPLSPDEKIYFMQQVDRINSSIKILLWMRDNIESNEKFWIKFLNWTKS